tara:strand:- start:48 stop:272 length:225 start_codon:yes stop_codon:yes gene_type:complete
MFGRKKKVAAGIQTVESAIGIFDRSMNKIHAANDIIVGEQQTIIDEALAIQDTATSEVKKSDNFKRNFAKLFED